MSAFVAWGMVLMNGYMSLSDRVVGACRMEKKVGNR